MTFRWTLWSKAGAVIWLLTSTVAAACPDAPTCRLEALRTQIDAADARIVQAMAERLAVAREIGAVKQAAGLPVVNAEREAVVIARFVEKARAQGIPEETARTVIQSLIAAARAVQ